VTVTYYYYPGGAFAVTPTSVIWSEGSSTSLTGEAGGSQKIYWIEIKNGVETVLAEDQLTLTVSASRVAGAQSYVIQFKAIYPTEIKTMDIPFTLTVDPSPYRNWAGDPTQGLTTGVNDGPLDDPDHDGISNLLEFALGGAPMVASRTVLPKLTRAGSTWIYEYERSNAAQSTTIQVVEYGSTLTDWTPVTVPATTSGIVIITPGSPSDHVKVTLPDQGPKGFVRIRVSQ